MRHDMSQGRSTSGRTETSIPKHYPQGQIIEKLDLVGQPENGNAKFHGSNHCRNNIYGCSDMRLFFQGSVEPMLDLKWAPIAYPPRTLHVLGHQLHE